MNFDDMIKGAGIKLELAITADDGNALGQALQRVIDDIGMAKQSAYGVSDEYAYKFYILK